MSDSVQSPATRKHSQDEQVQTAVALFIEKARLRQWAVEQAVQTPEASVDNAVDLARDFYEFVTGSASKEEPLPF